MKRTELIESFARRYIQFVTRQHWLLLFLAILLTGLALYPIFTQLRLNNDLASLLPQDTPSVIALNESYDRFGSTDKFMIAMQSSDPQLIADLQTEIKAAMDSSWEDVLATASIANDNSFYKENALLYLPIHHLERMRNNLEEIQNELGRDNLPLVVDLLDDLDEDNNEEEKTSQERVWFDASLPQELGLPDEAVSAFESFFNKQDSTQTEKEWDSKASLPKHLKTRLIGQLNLPDTLLYNGVVQCKLLRPSTDIEFVSKVLEKSDALLAKFRARQYSSPIRFTVEGTYESLKEVEDLKSDGFFSFGVSGILILFLVIWFFSPAPPRKGQSSLGQWLGHMIGWGRGALIAPLLLLTQVGFACLLMLGFTAVWYGQLNPFTLFVASIILGMGIDYSIHFMGTCQRLHTQSNNLQEALVGTIVHLASPMALAALTTICGLLTLLFAHFTGFYEFGVIASVGILFSVGSAILGLPVLLILMKGLPQTRRGSFFPQQWNEKQINGFMNRIARIALVVTIPLIMLAPFAEFEHDFQKLRRPKRMEARKHRIGTGVAVGSKRSTSTPAVVMGDTPEQLNKLYDTLMVRLHTDKDPYLKSFLTLKTFVPGQEAQKERLEMIEEIRDLINARVFDRATGNDSTNIATLRHLVQVDQTFGPQDIPAWSKDMLREKNGHFGTIGFIYGRFRSGDAREIGTFQDRYAHWNFGGRNLRVFSSQFIISDVVRVVKKDSFTMGILITIVILLTLALSLRNRRLLFVSFVSLMTGIIWTAGLMGLTTLLIDLGKVGIYNVIVIPTVLGVGIDSTIHLLISWHDDARYKGLRYLYDTTGKMVMASTLTTMAGFSGVLFITHKGMRTIGELSTIGLMSFLLASVIIVPWLSVKLFPPQIKAED